MARIATTAGRKLRAVVTATLFLLAAASPALSDTPGDTPSTSDQDKVRDALEDMIEDTLGDLMGRRPGRPAPITPADGATVPGNLDSISFEWQEGKRARTYQIEIDCLGCESPGQWSLDARGRTWMVVPDLARTSYELPTPANTGTFRWRVRGLRGERAGEWSVWSTFSLLPAYGYPEPEDSPVVPYAGGSTGTGTFGVAPGTAINISALAISGQWISSSGRLYDLAQAGPRFVWSTADGAEHGSAVVTADGRIQVEQWSGTSGPVPVQGRVAGIDELGGATGIEWSNGVVFSRYTGQGAPPPAGGAPSGPAPREGYCCLNGTVYQARDVDCANYGGMFFEDLNAAQQACGR